MNTPAWLERLRQRWKLNTIRQVLVVLLVFACTGFTIYFLKKPLLRFLAGPNGHSVFIDIAYYVLILPVYNLLLLGYGFIFGHFRFFWNFERRFFKRIFSNIKTTKK